MAHIRVPEGLPGILSLEACRDWGFPQTSNHPADRRTASDNAFAVSEVVSDNAVFCRQLPFRADGAVSECCVTQP